jgi:hypothetical protein
MRDEHTNVATRCGKRGKHMTIRNYIMRFLALAASAVAGGLATAAFFLLLWPEAAGDALLNAGGFTVLSESQEAVYPLVNDALRDVLRLRAKSSLRGGHFFTIVGILQYQVSH